MPLLVTKEIIQQFQKNVNFLYVFLYLTFKYQIYDADKLTIVHRYQIPCDIESLKWSPDDSFIMCINTKKSLLHLRNLKNSAIEMNLENWTGTITEELLAGAIWTADSRQIITFTDMQLRATVWSLIEQKLMASIKGPKLLPPKGYDFSSNGKFMCLAEKKEGDYKDQISIYYAGNDFKLTNSFDVSKETFDLADCKWIMKNTGILVQDSVLESKFIIYSAVTGRPLKIHQPNSNCGLGIRQLK